MANWDKITSSGNVEDRRRIPLAVGGAGGISLLGAVAYIVFSLLSGGNLASTLDQLGTAPQNVQIAQEELQAPDDYPKFASAVLGSANDEWEAVFAQSDTRYREPRLVLFRAATQSACGVATSDVGPHYCPDDETIYLDETFFDELQRRFKAQGGDVAQAYVIAHEVGHHVQNQLGIISRSQEGNAESIRVELQADCFAGVWAYSVNKQGVFEPGEVGEAIDAAAAVGDDRIQKAVSGRVNPETWTHGSSADRVSWFNRGYESGDPSQCNTFR